MRKLGLSILFSIALLAVEAQFAPGVGFPGTTAIAFDSSIIKSWAIACTVQRGWQNISDTSLGYTTAGNDSFALRRATDNPTVSLGDAGQAVLSFPYPITNGSGFDFVVFENAFIDSFLELAHVEVSSDGKNFYRFPSFCNTDTSMQLSNAGLSDATKIHNLAGKYRMGYGTPFDLEELKHIPGLDVNQITHVKVVDAIGSVQSVYGSRDSRGHLINDPWPTPFASGGFDLDGVGVINEYKNLAIRSSESSIISIYPNPTRDYLYILSPVSINEVAIMNAVGTLTKLPVLNQKIDISSLQKGLYFIALEQQYFSIVKYE